MDSGVSTVIETKSEEALIEEKEASVNYSKNLGKIGQALRRHLADYPDCFHKTGMPYTPDQGDL